MKEAPIPLNEAERIRKLQHYEILDTLPEADFDDFTLLASAICETPIALISLVDENRQWFKSKVGLDAEETPREIAFCSHSILQNDVFVVSDTEQDSRFHDNPLTTGEPYIKFYAGAPLVTPTGEKLGTICVIDTRPRELTEIQSKSLQALSRQIINQLELRLLNIQIKKTVQSKALFLSTMSHEIRTPLNGILGCANILNDMIESSDQKEMAGTILNCGESLLSLINDVLDYSKIESGKMEIERKAFSLSSTLKNVVQLFSSIADDKNTNLKFAYSEDTPTSIFGDPVRIRQVVSNLLSNAIKFTPSGNVHIFVDASKQNESDYLIKISVSDDGIGIDLDEQKKLFKPFSQVDASTSRKFGGTGLGLSICKSLVDLMDGEIWFESEKGKGSTFGFTFVTQAANTANIEPKIVTSQASLATKAPLRILVAEDNSVNKLVIEKLLQNFGYNAEIASNGREALDILEKQSFDLILMDRFMPKMDGLTATLEIRQNPEKYGRPRVVALTASAMKEDREACFTAGMDDFLTKPFDRNAIEAVLEESFQQTLRSA